MNQDSKPAAPVRKGVLLHKTVRWYLEHQDWVERVRSGSYREWISRHYGT